MTNFALAEFLSKEKKRSVLNLARIVGYMSVRTIQRRLTDEGVKFLSVLQNTRKLLDKGLDNLPNLKKADRAFLLGFNHIDSYYRAMTAK